MSDNVKILGESLLKEDPKKKFSFVIKEKAIRTEHLSDAVIAYIDSKGSGGSPSDLIQTITTIVTEQLQPYINHISDTVAHFSEQEKATFNSMIDEVASLGRRMDAVELSLSSLGDRVTAIENELHPPVASTWYIGQVTRETVEQFTEMSVEALLQASQQYLLTNKNPQFFINNSYFFVMVPEGTTINSFRYCPSGSSVTYDVSGTEVMQEWPLRNPHSAVMINGSRYLVYAGFNYDFINSNTWGQFIIN